MQYIPEVNALLTSSVDCTIAFTDVSRGEVTKIFKGHEGHVSTAIGIKAFDWSAFGKYVISGAERTLLLWDPYTLEVMGKIDNLRSPVISVETSDVMCKIFTCLINKNVLVHHNITLELLQVVSDTTLYKPVDTMASMKFVAEKSMLFTAGNRVTAWTLERAAESASDNEEEDIVTVLYNSLFNQVLVVKSLGTLKVYQTEVSQQELVLFVASITLSLSLSPSPSLSLSVTDW
jgi:WD40 repeat protein